MSAAVVQLGQVATTVMGQAPPGNACNKDGIGTVFVKAGEFSEALPLVREWTTKPLKMAAKADVLVCVVGATAGKVSRSIECAIGRSVSAVRPKPDLLSTEYLFHFLSTKVLDLRNSSQGMAQGVITRDMLESMEIPLPPLGEQRRIAAILDQADALRRKRREALARLNDLVWAHFIDAFGDPLVGAQKWPLSRLGDHIVEVTNGLTRRRKEGDQGDDIVLRLRDIRAGYIEFEEPNRITLSEKEKRKYQVFPDDVLFIRVNGNPDYVGRCAQFSGFDENVYFNDHIMRVRVKMDSINPDFLQVFLNSEAGRKQISIHKKTSAGQHTINQDGLSKIMISIPPIAEQDRFSALGNRIRRQIEIAENHLTQLEALFSSLQHRAFQGEL